MPKKFYVLDGTHGFEFRDKRYPFGPSVQVVYMGHPKADGDIMLKIMTAGGQGLSISLTRDEYEKLLTKSFKDWTAYREMGKES